MPERIVGLVRPYEHKAGSWMVIVPKDLVRKENLEDSFKTVDEKIVVYYDRQRKRIIYQLPEDYRPPAPQTGDL